MRWIIAVICLLVAIAAFDAVAFLLSVKNPDPVALDYENGNR
jgi:hypothetical protein